MINIGKLVDDELKKTPLEILVFGPVVDPPSSDPYIASLQVKRKEIKQKLIDEGHTVYFGEDIVDSSISVAVLVQEIAAMRQADLIFVLVASPGTIMEATSITHERELCGKASFYCFQDHKDGLVAQHLQFVVQLGAACELVSLADVQACKLTGAVLAKVRSVQMGKGFLF